MGELLIELIRLGLGIYHVGLLAVVVWREARGEGETGMRAVAHVIRNRVLATHLPDKWDDVITAKWQFSSMTAPGDGMLVQWPKDSDPTFKTALRVAAEVYCGESLDPTGGATHYANLHVCNPEWAHSLAQVAVIGKHTFFRAGAC